MKKFNHPEETMLTGPRYWKSLDDLHENPAFNEWMHREFPTGASELEGVNRRQFMKIMGASFAMAGVGLSGCRRPEQKILPYSKQPERIIPGNPVYYASAKPDAWDSLPLVVETHEARPTKIEGNGQYKPYGGATNLIAQASILDLYDPDRATKHYEGTVVKDEAAVRDLIEQLRKDHETTNGKGLAILAQPSTSATRARLRKVMKARFPKTAWHQYHPVKRNNLFEAWKLATGKPSRPNFHFTKAKRILSVDSDFSGNEPGAVGWSRDFAKTRKVANKDEASKMSRLYSVESLFTLTGSMADHRLRLNASEMTAFLAACVAAVLAQKHGDEELIAFLNEKARSVRSHQQWIKECVEDLLHFEGESLVVVGSHLPVEAHVLAISLNSLLHAFGNTIDAIEDSTDTSDTLSGLIKSIEANEVSTLLILGGNPVYDLPASTSWEKWQKKVPKVIRLGYYVDETSVAAIEQGGWHISTTHFLESWDDARTWDGTYVPVQPMIEPLLGGIQENEILARFAGVTKPDPYTLVQDTAVEILGKPDAGAAFRKFLFDGFAEGTEAKAIALKNNVIELVRELFGKGDELVNLSVQNLELRIFPDKKVFDGRYNNNGWLQECPDPMTKLTWDNAILISPKLAKEIGWDPVSNRLLAVSAKEIGSFKRESEDAPVVKLIVGGNVLRAPLQVQPGLPDYTIALSMGYGRTKVGRVGQQTGVSAFEILPEDGSLILIGAKLELTEEIHKLATTQEHWSMEGRAIVREANTAFYEENVDFAEHMGMESHSPALYGSKQNASLQEKVTTQPQGNMIYKSPVFTDPAPNVEVWNTEKGKKEFKAPQQWGMTIDLNLCNGCNACVVACQGENNIPIVGKQQVMRGREMHWIRMDRYYSSGDKKANMNEIPEDPQVSLMPMACQHCETAPCEQVCPVNATVHDEQGLNVMAYNRCVGTRYCANNCPYKVRRFNFFDYNKRDVKRLYEGPLGPNKYEDELMQELPAMQRNPDVTVRMRGVMEKCTYCQQRIEQARIAQRVKAKNSGDIDIPDGTIKTACQQVCPAEAIVFGALDDPKSAVSLSKENDRDYAVLGYLNTRPRTTYLARLRNPNPKMPDYHLMPLSTMEYNGGTDSHGSHADQGEGGSNHGNH